VSSEYVDVLIVGAGLSGIGAACHLQSGCPDRSYAIFEARERIGGTWDLFRYPGIRSDSDMYTLGYRFRPWRDANSLADGPSILRYLHETASEHGVREKIRLGHRVTGAHWSSEDSCWKVDAEVGESGEPVQIRAGFLWMCTGYYSYEQGYTPSFPGSERFRGQIVHPQQWTEDLRYEDKRVVVIGSGATAVTLVPALARRAAHVTMLQRSPSYIVSIPGVDPIAQRLRAWLPERIAYPIVRWKNVMLMLWSFQLARRRPRLMKSLIRKGLEQRLPEGYDIDTHFKPRYGPWDQRLCFVPDGDLFEAIAAGRASIVTDQIQEFTESGLRLRSGAELEADLIVTATGLNMLSLGGASLTVDGSEISAGQTMNYRGTMLSGVPNLAMTFGYTNASWTLKADLTSAYVCRLLNHMQARGYVRCIPHPDPNMASEPFIDFSSSYVVRAIDRFPRQGARPPWRLHQNYALDILNLRLCPIEDGTMEFSRAARTAAPTEALAV
jgi:cation diffusion facilitator CzcD-associated flavoprotein CzcO